VNEGHDKLSARQARQLGAKLDGREIGGARVVANEDRPAHGPTGRTLGPPVKILAVHPARLTAQLLAGPDVC
jgi:hypothetical protein